jgi:hypothetical protein
MKLLFVHQILIGSALGLAALFATRSLVLFLRGGTTSDLVVALVAAAAGGALYVYFRKVRAKWRAENERG